MNYDCVQYIRCWYAQNRLMSMGVPVILWMMGRNPAVIISFDMIVDTDMVRPLEEILSPSLEDLSSIETNR